MKKNFSVLYKISVIRFFIALIVCFSYSNGVQSQHIDNQPSSSRPAKGINFFYLNGRDQEDLVQIAEKLYFGDEACKGTRDNIEKRFDTTIREIKTAGFEWVRLLVSKDFYQIYAPRCGFNMDEVYPVLAKKHLSVLSHLIDKIADNGLKIEIVLSGVKWFAEPESDIIFFESVLSGLPLEHIHMVMLGGDVQPANAKYQADWLKKVLPHFLNHKNPELAAQNYLFDTVTYRSKKQALSYIKWVKKHFPNLKYLPVNLYNRSLPVGSSWQEYSKAISVYVDVYQSAGLPLWIDEYGFRLSNSTEEENYTESDRVEYLKGFYHALSCSDKAPAAYFIWTAGNDRYHANPEKDHDRTPFGLFAGYNENEPVTTPAWNEVALFNTTSSYCKQFVEKN